MKINYSKKRMWGEKPYHSLDWELKHRFGEKIYKLALDGGMTCPNRDGKIGRNGCIFCSAGGSGDFAADRRLSVTEQIAAQKEALKDKKPAQKFIAYFQAYTNTYGEPEYLKNIFTEAINDPDVVILSVATRPDCLPQEILDLLEKLNRIKPVWVELGLQTMHDDTAKLIRRGYSLEVFERAVTELRRRGLEVIVHTIIGLPGEGEKEILDTIGYLNHCDIQGIKLQLLHILEGTDLGRWYEQKKDVNGREIQVLTQEEYIRLILACVTHLRPEITIHRLTGDGPKDLLLAPLWSTRKRSVLNDIHGQMKRAGIWQGKDLMSEGDKNGRSTDII